MHKNAAEAAGAVPDPAEFRAWVQECLGALNVSGARIARAAGLNRNLVAAFLASDGGNIGLRTAHGITCALRAEAVAQGVELPAGKATAP